MKIDYVMPYVDNTDDNWLNLYNQYSKENKHDKAENSKRFSTNILFKYVFRGIDKYMPWINNIFLIVQSDSQVPKWINRDTVKIVYHDDFIPKEFLPTFNSCTIECFLHRIPGLSPFYIYGNDDTYVMDHIEQTDFFDMFMPKNKLHRHWLNPRDEYSRMCLNMNNTAARVLHMPKFERYYYAPIHFQQAFSKSITEHTFNMFSKKIYESITRFRSEKNLSQYFFILYYMFSTNSRYTFNGVRVQRDDIIQEFDRIIKRFDKKIFPQLFCLNNNDNKKDIALLSQFQKIFPYISKYEI